MTDYEKVARKCLLVYSELEARRIAKALRTAVEKEREENIKIVRDMDNRLYGDACMTAKFQKHIEEAIRNRGKDGGK